MLQVKSKYKICKRLGGEVFEKCQSQKFMLAESRRANVRTRRRGRGPSDYGKQLIEKQKIRYAYGIHEKQFRSYVEEAKRTGGADPANRFFQLLEMRLDNTAYRMGLAKTRRMARQLVSHGHVTVNGRRITIPSYTVREGDVISVREGSKEKVPFLFEEAPAGVPNWLAFDVKALSGTITGLPTLVPGETTFDFAQVVEFYSR